LGQIEKHVLLKIKDGISVQQIKPVLFKKTRVLWRKQILRDKN
jgi:hypothetical protein